MKDKIELCVLPSGLRLACRHSKGAGVEYCGAVVKAGSRNDLPSQPGMAHFVEHTIFKGTPHRSSWHIINRMERVGGELNAYTSKEETVVYTAAPAGNAARSLELIADLLANSRFPDSELDKEREVVADEINSYLDTPSEAVYDDFEELIFANSAMAHNILGSAEALASFHSDECRQYLRNWYAADNMAIFYYGPASPSRIAQLVEKHFAMLPLHCHPAAAATVAAPEPFDVKRNLGLHQAHTVMGCRVPGMYSADKYAIALITNILGGPGMNSRLNVSLREKRGYVYSVEASTSLFTDCGEFNIYFGCDPGDTAQCSRLVQREIDRLASETMSATALAMAKKQYLGQLAVASDNRESVAISLGRAMLYHGEWLEGSEIEKRVHDVSPERIRQQAEAMQRLSSLTLN